MLSLVVVPGTTHVRYYMSFRQFGNNYMLYTVVFVLLVLDLIC